MRSQESLFLKRPFLDIGVRIWAFDAEFADQRANSKSKECFGFSFSMHWKMAVGSVSGASGRERIGHVVNYYVNISFDKT